MPLDESVVSQFGQMNVLSFDVRRRIPTGNIRRRIEVNRRFAWRQIDEREQYPSSVFISQYLE